MPRFRMTRLSPSRTSMVFRSLSRISRVICSRRFRSIGLAPVLALAPALPLSRAAFFPEDFLAKWDSSSLVSLHPSSVGASLLDVAGLKLAVERREDLAAGMRDEHVVFDAHATFAGEVDPGLDGNDHPRPQLFVAAGFAYRAQ